MERVRDKHRGGTLRKKAFRLFLSSTEIILRKFVSSNVILRIFAYIVNICQFLPVMNCIYTDNAVITGSSLRSALIYFYLSNEDASLPENASRLGQPVLEKLREV